MDRLGDTITKIAREKAAIIERGDLAVTGARGDGLAVVRRRARRMAVPLTEVDAAPLLGWDRDGIEIDLPRLGRTRIGLRGRHQAANAAIADATLDALEAAGIATVPDDARRRGLRERGLARAPRAGPRGRPRCPARRCPQPGRGDGSRGLARRPPAVPGARPAHPRDRLDGRQGRRGRGRRAGRLERRWRVRPSSARAFPCRVPCRRPIWPPCGGRPACRARSSSRTIRSTPPAAALVAEAVRSRPDRRVAVSRRGGTRPSRRRSGPARPRTRRRPRTLTDHDRRDARSRQHPHRAVHVPLGRADVRDGHPQRHARLVLGRRPPRGSGRETTRSRRPWRRRSGWSPRAPTSSTSAANRRAPGTRPVSADEERARVLPVIAAVRTALPDTPAQRRHHQARHRRGGPRRGSRPHQRRLGGRRRRRAGPARGRPRRPADRHAQPRRARLPDLPAGADRRSPACARSGRSVSACRGTT